MTREELFRRSIKIDEAKNVRNVFGEDMSEFNGCVCMNNGVVAFVYKGYYYLTPDGYKAFKCCQDELGLQESFFMVLCSMRTSEKPKGWESRWAFLWDTRS